MTKLRLLTLIILAAATVVATGAYAKKKQDNAVHAPMAHHVIYAEWETGQDGTRTLRAIRVRDVDASGAWTEWSANRKSDRTRISDHTDQTKPGEFFHGAAGYKSAAFFRSRPNFLREENILGYQCFTLDLGGAESSFSPALGMTPLKFASKGGTVIEALKVY